MKKIVLAFTLMTLSFASFAIVGGNKNLVCENLKNTSFNVYEVNVNGGEASLNNLGAMEIISAVENKVEIRSEFSKGKAMPAGVTVDGDCSYFFVSKDGQLSQMRLEVEDQVGDLIRGVIATVHMKNASATAVEQFIVVVKQ